MAVVALLGACRQKPVSSTALPEGSVIISDRLSNQKVNAFTQDKDGHVWIATFRGLNKSTAHEFYQYFCTDDTLGLPDNQINAVHAARDGKLWVGTVNGAAYRTHTGQFKRVAHGNAFSSINQILETGDGKILMADGNTLFQYDPQEEYLRPVIREYNSFGSPSALIDDHQQLWVISENGFRLKAYSTQDFSLLQSIPLHAQTYHICQGFHDDLWLSGMGELAILNTRSGQWQELPEAIRSCPVIMHGDIDILFKTDETSLLMNVIGKGYYLYNHTRKTLLSQADADFPLDIPKSEVRCLFRDRQGNLWFGTTDKGFHVSYHELGQFGGNKHLTQAFKGKNVTALCPDRQGGLWITTLNDGLYRYDLSSREILPVDVRPLIPDDQVGYIRTSSVYCDTDGDLWLLFSDKMRVIRCLWNGKRLLPQDIVYAFSPLSLQEDDRGAFWIGGIGRNLIRFDKKDKSRQEIPIGDPEKWTFVTDMQMEKPGEMLVACFNQSPSLVNTYSLEYSIRNISPEEQKSCIRRSIVIPNCLFKDSGGSNWLGTIANGLIVRDSRDGRLRPIDGISCQDITSIEEDRQGNIWVSSMHGLYKWDRTTGHLISYFEADGIGGDQFNDRASCILPDGTLVFGGTHGITWFNPLDAPAKRTVPLVFESLSIHNTLAGISESGPIDKTLSEKPQVTIAPDQNAFSISFAALDYSEFEQIRYAYMLEGFDKDWVKINTRHDAYFANIPPGEYTLHVKIANGSHSITETEESLNICILAPWHKTWWARMLFILLGLLLIGLIFLLYQHLIQVREEAAQRIRVAREEREEAQKAEEAEKALNKIQMSYFANVAHEFRTPLTMIAGPAQQLATSESVKGQDRQLVDIIRRNATWMLSLVNQLLDFNRIGNSKLQLKVAKTDIVSHLRDTADLFRFNARSKGIELSTVGLEESFTMWVDADKLQKMVMNLLSNAMKYTPSGGRVTLSFDVIPRGEAATLFPLTEKDQDGQWACVSVSDTGPGIPEDEIEKIFERFYQTASRSDKHGSGIGLFYARALSHLHHGYIKAWNKEEGGALFRLILPVSGQAYTEDEKTSEKPQLQLHALAESLPAETQKDPGKLRHIAVVDDDIDIANYLKVLLSENYRVSEYFDAASALKSMEEDAPDLIISDVVMPGMDGYELCGAIKGNLQLSHIPVVLVTAKVAVENQIQGLDKGADAYVTKPFQPAYLLALVKSLLENREKLHRQLGSVTTTEDIAPEALTPRDAAFMKELYELMEKELSNADLDIVRMTEMMKISRTKFYYKVKGLTGENPSVFFKRYKLNRAADLLKEGKHNMSEIAWMTGFNTLSHFSTSFKKQFGVPPSEYAG